MLDSEDGDADDCEGNGLGVDRDINQVDEDPETRTGAVSADCPAGGYTVRVILSSAANEELASTSVDFTIIAPVVDISLSADSVEEGSEIIATMSFSDLKSDDDNSDTDYIFRADVKDSEDGDADDCEGGGMGVDRIMNQVDQDPETRTGAVSGDCPGASTPWRSAYRRRAAASWRRQLPPSR